MNRSRAIQSGSAGSCRITFWNNKYPTGARLIAVPGWPLPTFSTASAAKIRVVSTALRSRSVQFTKPVATVLNFLPGRGVEPGVAARLDHKVEPSTWPYHGLDQWPEDERVAVPVGAISALVRVPVSLCPHLELVELSQLGTLSALVRAHQIGSP
jgi:hypothetical protein